MSEFNLTAHGITVAMVYRNPPPAVLYEEAIRHESGTRISATGALIAYSGDKTGRSPKDKRVVREPEPLPAGSPLWDVPNLILTPHVSSDDDVSYVPKTLDLVFDNLGRLLAGRPLRNRVRPALGY